MVTDPLLPVLDSLKSLDFSELVFEDLFFVVLRLPFFFAPFFLEVVLRFLVVLRFFVVEDFLFVVFLFVEDFFFVVVVVVDEVFVELEAFLFQQKNTKCISSVSKIHHQNEFPLLYRRRE